MLAKLFNPQGIMLQLIIIIGFIRQILVRQFLAICITRREQNGKIFTNTVTAYTCTAGYLPYTNTIAFELENLFSLFHYYRLL